MVMPDLCLQQYIIVLAANVHVCYLLWDMIRQTYSGIYSPQANTAWHLTKTLKPNSDEIKLGRRLLLLLIVY